MNSPSLLERFQQSCTAHADRVAFVFTGGSYTYRQFASIVQGIRDHLEEVVEPSERCVAIYATQDVQTYASIYAVLATGRAYVPLNPAAPADRNFSCIEQASIRTILCSKTVPVIQSWADVAGEKLRALETSSCPAGDHLKPIATVDDDAMAYLLFTSGSTGTPKGVPIYHRNLRAFLADFVDRSDYTFGSDDRFLQMFDLTFDLSVMSFAVPLSVGGACHVVPTEGHGFISVVRTLEKGSVTVALMVPSVIGFLQRYFNEISLPSLRLSLFCGEALPAGLAREWWSCAPAARLVNVYGPTEATIFCSAFELDRQQPAGEEYLGVVAIGRPFPQTVLRVVGEDLHDAASGEKGELVISGAQLTDQYWNNPDKTAAAFVQLPDGSRGYRSGDLVFLDGSNLFYCGRIDNQLKVDGYRVEAGEIEHHARLLEGVRDAVLVGVPKAGGGVMLHAFLLVDDATIPLPVKEYKATLSSNLPSYMLPQKFHACAEYPLNQNGKVDRKALIARVAGEK